MRSNNDNISQLCHGIIIKADRLSFIIDDPFSITRLSGNFFTLKARPKPLEKHVIELITSTMHIPIRPDIKSLNTSYSHLKG